MAARRIQDNGRIINIGTSLLGATTGFYAANAGTKAPVEQFTRALAKEIGSRGVTVNTVAPGAVDIPFFHGEESRETVEYIERAHVSGRLANVEGIVGTVSFLASPRPSGARPRASSSTTPTWLAEPERTGPARRRRSVQGRLG